MFLSEQRRRVAHALRPSTVRKALKGAKKSIKARFVHSSPTPVSPSSRIAPISSDVNVPPSQLPATVEDECSLSTEGVQQALASSVEVATVELKVRSPPPHLSCPPNGKVKDVKVDVGIQAAPSSPAVNSHSEVRPSLPASLYTVHSNL